MYKKLQTIVYVGCNYLSIPWVQQQFHKTQLKLGYGRVVVIAVCNYVPVNNIKWQDAWLIVA